MKIPIRGTVEGWRKVTKRDGGRIMRGCTDEDVTKGTVKVT